LTKSRFPQQAHRKIAALSHSSVFGCDGWLLDPFLQALDSFLVLLLNLREDGSEIVVVGACATGKRQSSGTRESTLQEVSPVHERRA
jgi:hypothetical protein